MKIQMSLLLVLLVFSSLMAQPNKRLAPALGQFMQTEFMVKFHDLKLEAESTVQNIIAKEQKLKPDDVTRIRIAFEQTGQRANKIIEGIKQDFLDPKRLKAIELDPNIYSDGLKLKLMELQDFYSSHFQQAVADATADQVDGSPLLFIITELIGLAKGLSSYFAQMQRESRMYTEDYLNQHLVKPHRWRYWNEVQANEAQNDHYSDNIQYHDIQTNPNAPAVPTPDLNTWNNGLKKTNNNGGYNNPGYNNNDPGYNNNPNSAPGTYPPPATTYPPDNTMTMPPADTLNQANDPFKYEQNPAKKSSPNLPADQNQAPKQSVNKDLKNKVNLDQPKKVNNN